MAQAKMAETVSSLTERAAEEEAETEAELPARITPGKTGAPAETITAVPAGVRAVFMRAQAPAQAQAEAAEAVELIILLSMARQAVRVLMDGEVLMAAVVEAEALGEGPAHPVHLAGRSAAVVVQVETVA